MRSNSSRLLSSVHPAGLDPAPRKTEPHHPSEAVPAEMKRHVAISFDAVGNVGVWRRVGEGGGGGGSLFACGPLDVPTTVNSIRLFSFLFAKHATFYISADGAD